VNWGNTDYGQQTKGTVTFGGAPFSYRGSGNFSKITDGTSNTLMMAEIIATTTTGWGGPLSDFQLALGSQTFNGWYTPNSKTFDEVSRQCPAAGDLNGIPGCTNIGGSGTEPNQVFVARSKHTGGVHALLCDGAVRFISDNIDLNVWRNLSTARGGEVVGEF
jgi:hypothetical protein